MGLEGTERLRRVTGIEGALVPVGAKVLAGLVPGMVAKLVAGVSVAAAVMRVVVGLKQAVLLDDPGDFRAHIGPYDSGGDFRVVVGSQVISHIVDQRRDDEFVIGAVPERTGRGLQGVAQTAHAIALQPSVQFAQRSEYSLRQGVDVIALGFLEQLVILAGAVLHAQKTHHPGGAWGPGARYDAFSGFLLHWGLTWRSSRVSRSVSGCVRSQR